MYIDIVERFDKTGMSKLKMSQEIKIAYEAFCKIYNRETSSIRFSTLESLCNALNCTPNDILKFGEYNPNRQDD